MRPMTIGRLSKAGGVKVTTIRYYESIGLMEEPARSDSGQRLYGEEAVRRLGFIRHARELGFPVTTIRELIALQTSPGKDCEAVDTLARRQLKDVRERIARLRALESELSGMIASCEGGVVGECKVMESLLGADQD